MPDEDGGRFTTGFRGYARAEVDAYLERVGRRLAELTAENEQLRRRTADAEAQVALARGRVDKLESDLAGTMVSLRAAEAQIEALRREDARRLDATRTLVGRIALEAARRRRAAGAQESPAPGPAGPGPPPPPPAPAWDPDVRSRAAYPEA